MCSWHLSVLPGTEARVRAGAEARVRAGTEARVRAGTEARVRAGAEVYPQSRSRSWSLPKFPLKY